MRNLNKGILACSLAGLLMFAEPLQAQFAVIDATSVAQLVQQLQIMSQELATARSQLLQAQQALQTMTGARGMQNLLSGTARNYLPTDWSGVQALGQGTGGAYASLAGTVGGLISTNAVVDTSTLSSMPEPEQQNILASRQLIATSQALARAALSNASGRFGALQSLIAAIGSTNDQKSVLELSARIGAELGMLQNEQIKLQNLNQSLQAQDLANRQQQHELDVAGQGNFSTRLRPAP